MLVSQSNPKKGSHAGQKKLCSQSLLSLIMMRSPKNKIKSNNNAPVFRCVSSLIRIKMMKTTFQDKNWQDKEVIHGP